MKEDKIKKLIYEFWEKDLKEVRERIVNLKFLSKNLVNDIVGVRRAGKTYFLFFLTKKLEKEFGREQFIYLNCEHRSIYPLKVEELNYLVKFFHEEDLLNKKIFLFLDEVQAVKGWEIFVKSIYDEFENKIKIIVSGSVKSLLSKDYGRFLSGRHQTIKIFPLSFKEYLIFKDIQAERITEEKEAKIRKAAKNFLKYGSFPKYVLTEDLTYLEQIFSDIIERDIKSRVEIRKKDVIDELINLLLERAASKISFTKLKNLLRSKGYRISTDLIIRYASICEDVFLFFFLPIYSAKYSEVIKNPKKVYVVDNGFINLFPLRISENFGKLMENCVFLELIKSGFDVGKEISYYKVNDSEVDFVIKEGLEIKQLIQVTYASNKDEIEKREIRALIKASEQLKCKDLLIITWDYEDEINVENKKIKCIPLWKWLLFK
ncbi:MAG: ATP-binding protein [Candidatus Aenigmatarchaeota archaeon]